ncbi:MAG TPA: chemotaxis protein CheA, partial [Arcobacter sp.]|nr:chemotaxis protein CheA [Arcobacter sp.]
MDEIKEAFLEEGQELFERINTILLEAEEEGKLKEDSIDKLFRDIHTLKGSSGSVGFVKFTKITHIFENFLVKIRNKELKVDREVLDFLIESVDRLEKILAEEADGNLTDEKFNQYVDYFDNLIEGFLGSKKRSDNEKKGRDELLKRNGGEIVDLFEKIYQILLSYDKTNEITQKEKDELFRYFHTLKASSQFIGFSIFSNFIHEIENLLDKIRNNNIEYNKIVHSFMKVATKKAEEIIDLEINSEFKEAEKIYKNIKKDVKGLENRLNNGDINDKKSYDKEDKNGDRNQEIVDNSIQDSNEEKDDYSSESRKKSLKKIVSSSSIRVNLDKIDILMNKVGDLVITKSMLFQFAEALKDYHIKNLIIEKLEVLDRNIRELQESVMSVRMIPMSSVYQKIPKIIRDVSKKLNKDIKFEHYGDTVEIDKLMVEALMDPLTHILRNAIDHGIEPKEERINVNKPNYGKIIMTASQESGQIIISIEDDGAGIDVDKVGAKAVEKGIISEEELRRLSPDDIAMLIFSPGLSTAEKISDISGRGVGMDVVMNNINAIGGTIKIFTKKGVGTKFVIILPLTLAILDGLNVRVGKYKFVYPLNMVLESFQPIKEIIKNIVK